ncbi:MAG: AbrB/MazE/SpoVT family DNA-binding domain-containing protein [Candidatus Bathyarchaeia archaeon]
MKIVRVDEKGRIVIPKSIRRKAEVKEGGYVSVEAREKTIILKPLEPTASKYYGAFKIVKWPEDLDEFIIEVVKEWWMRKAT